MPDPNKTQAATSKDLDVRAEREVQNLKELIELRASSLQGEIDRRFTNALERIETEANRALEGRIAERDHAEGLIDSIATRLDAMDKATKVLNEIVTRVPTDVQQAVSNMRDVMDEKFHSIEQQFQERDIRSEREARDNKVAVDAAFAAQKEAAARQDESNAKAIDKSENATKETINKLNDLLDALNRALSDKIDDLKARVTAIEAARIGGRESTQDRQAGVSTNTALISIVLTMIIIVVTIAIATHGFSK